MFTKCQNKNCNTVLETKKLQTNYFICPKCNYHATLTYQERIQMILDEESFDQINDTLGFQDPISFPDYAKKYNNAVNNTGLQEAIITGTGQINQIDVLIGIMDTRFMMSSMGTVVGEKITQLFEKGIDEKKPIIIFSSSGGARMQEGVLSLMQMAKTSAAAAKYSESGGLFISVLTNPTTGGVSASYAFLGDIILSEPGAMIGFAGPRVIKQTIQEELPEGFQTAEYLLEHGFLDAVIDRRELKNTLFFLLKYHHYQIIESVLQKGA